MPSRVVTVVGPSATRYPSGNIAVNMSVGDVATGGLPTRQALFMADKRKPSVRTNAWRYHACCTPLPPWAGGITRAVEAAMTACIPRVRVVGHQVLASFDQNGEGFVNYANGKPWCAPDVMQCCG